VAQAPLPVDDLRQKLKDLGYLGTGVDRFVLAPARQERSAARIAAGASVRVGLLAAILLGPAAAVGIAARLPQLVTGFGDACVVALYLALLFGISGAVLTFLAALATRTIVRAGAIGVTAKRARFAATTAGIVMSAASLAYLALWWSAVNPGPAWTAPVWTAAVLAAALAISLVIGHAVAVTVGAVLARESAPASVPEPAPARHRAAFLLRVAAFAAAAALLVAAVGPAGTSATPVPPPDFAVVPTGQRVIVIGIDGFDPELMGIPTNVRIGSFINSPIATALAYAPGTRDTDPARVWTTIATGVPPDRHGISALELRRVAGIEGALVPGASRTATAVAAATDLLWLARPAIASGSLRKVKTFWDVAAEKGLSSAVVNWWATWPATGPSANITDRAILRLEQAGALDAEIWPSELYDSLRKDWSKLLHEARQIAASAFGTIEDPTLRSVLTRSAEFDATVAFLSLHPAVGGRDLLAVYLPGLDIAQHALATAESSPAASALEARTEGIRQYYFFLGELIQRFGDSGKALLIVVTHPGRVSSAARAAIGAHGWIGARGIVGTSAATLDLAPTVLYALGIPVARDLSGKPLTELFNKAFVERHPVRAVDTYGQPSAVQAERGGKPLDQEMLDRLRSLGYVR
jgi:Type I phosphodiesterase / nucleotide pyrophosphatase